MRSLLPADAGEMSSHAQPRPMPPADLTEIAPGRWIRNRRRTRVWSALAAVWSLFVASRLLVGGGTSASNPAGVLLALAALYLPLAGLGLVLTVRVARAGVRIGPEGIVIRGPFRTHAVTLNSALRFSPGLQGRAGNGTPCPMLERRGDRAVGVWALGRRNIWFRYERLCQEIQPACAKLNALVEDMRSAGTCSMSDRPAGKSMG